MKLTEKQQLVAIITCASLLVVGELSFAYMNYSNRGELDTELAALETRQRGAESKIAQIPELQRRARDLSEIVDQYTEILPREDEVSPDAFLDDISGLCREVGLAITSATPIEVKQESKKQRPRRPVPGGAANEAKEPPKSFIRHKYRFEMEGEFRALHRFVNGVENHTRFLQVDAIEIKPLTAAKKSGKQNELELSREPRKAVTVEVSTYTYSRLPSAEEATQ